MAESNLDDKVRYGPVLKFEEDGVYTELCAFLECVADDEVFDEKDKINYYAIDNGIVKFDHFSREIRLSDKVPYDIYSGISEILGANVGGGAYDR